jgi:hypothetical protein
MLTFLPQRGIWVFGGIWYLADVDYQTSGIIKGALQI